MTMVSKYDVFYVIATRSTAGVSDIVGALHKTRESYDVVFKSVVELEKLGYVKRDGNVKIVHGERTNGLFDLISFCVHNMMNYNLLFKATMLDFLKNAAQKEFFTRKTVPVHGQTFQLYIAALEKYGLLLVVSRKPLKCRLLRHHFIRDLLRFFGRRVAFYESRQHVFIPGILKEFGKYQRLRRIHYTVLEDVERNEELRFIHASLKLEGNPLTLPETVKLIEENVVPEKHRLIHVQEVTNYKGAVDLMIENVYRRVPITLNLIFEYHRIAMAHIHGAGEIRRQNVHIKANPAFKTCMWRLLPAKLDGMMKVYHRFKSQKQTTEAVISFASFFHNEFQRIHPFIDGNSRTARLLMLHILRAHGLPVLDIPLGYFDLYMDMTKRSTRRDDRAFQQLIEEIVFYNLKKANAAI